MTFRETYNLHNKFLTDNKFQSYFFVSNNINTDTENFSYFEITSNNNLNKYIKLSATKEYIFIDFYNLEGNLKETKKYNNDGYEEIKKIIYNIFEI